MKASNSASRYIHRRLLQLPMISTIRFSPTLLLETMALRFASKTPSIKGNRKIHFIWINQLEPEEPQFMVSLPCKICNHHILKCIVPVLAVKTKYTRSVSNNTASPFMIMPMTNIQIENDHVLTRRNGLALPATFDDHMHPRKIFEELRVVLISTYVKITSLLRTISLLIVTTNQYFT